jgi:hypothetical protein
MGRHLRTNNFGIHLFELGHLKEARSHFLFSLESIRSKDMKPIRAPGFAKKKIRHEQLQQEARMTAAAIRYPIRGWSHQVKTTVVEGEEEDNLFVYSRTLYLNTSSFNPEHKDIYLCCITYNLALTHHLMALQGGLSSGYQTASDYYEDAMTLLETCLKKDGNCLTCSDDPHLNDLRVAILNNAGHIYYTDRINFSAAIQCFDAACGVVFESEISGGVLGLPEQDVRLMVGNVLMRYAMTAPMA